MTPEPKTESDGAGDLDFVPPGLEPSSERICLWAYRDDIGTEDCYVVDRCGRLVRPTMTKDYRDRFLDGVELAEYRIWENLPASALVLSWSKPSTSEQHEFKVIIEPDHVTSAQLERVAILTRSIVDVWEGRISPYDSNESPSMGNGWNLQKCNV